MLDMSDRTLQMELADFKDNLFKALSKMADTSDPNTYDNAIAIIADIEAAIRHEYPLIEYFNFLSSGAYKECYELPWPFDGWVMKLASRANNTVVHLSAVPYHTRRLSCQWHLALPVPQFLFQYRRGLYHLSREVHPHESLHPL